MDHKKEPSGVMLHFYALNFFWTFISFLVTTFVVFFYFPPQNVALPVLIDDSLIFGVINYVALSLLVMRFLEAATSIFASPIRSIMGRHQHKFIILVNLSMVVSSYFLFNPLDPENKTANLLQLSLSMSILVCSLAVIYTVFISYLPILTNESRTAFEINTKVAIFATLAVILVNFVPAFAEFLAADVEGNTSAYYVNSFTAFSFLSAFLTVCFYYTSTMRIKRMNRNAELDHSRIRFRDILDFLPVLFRHKSYRYYFFFEIASNTANMIFIQGTIYFVSDALGLDIKYYSYLMATVIFSSVFFLGAFGRFLSQENAYRLKYIATIIYALVCFLVYGSLNFQEYIQPIFLLFFAAAVVGFVTAIYTTIPFSLITNTILKDRESSSHKDTIFSLVIGFQKLGIGIGQLIVLTLLLLKLEITSMYLVGFIICLSLVVAIRMYRDDQLIFGTQASA